METESYNSLGGVVTLVLLLLPTLSEKGYFQPFACKCMCLIRWNKMLVTKSYSQCFKILLKMSVRIDIDRACD